MRTLMILCAAMAAPMLAAHPASATATTAPVSHATANGFTTVHSARRISGTTHLAMPSALAQTMVTSETREMDYRGKLCVDASGVPAFVEPVQKTGVPAADREVAHAVMGWRYRPYRVAGKAEPFCTGVRFRFKLKESTDAD